MSARIAIIGDNFMRADVFESALRDAVTAPFTCGKLDLPFPDEPIVQRGDSCGLAGLREFQGSPEQVVATAAGARVLVTHVAPISRGILRDLPDLEMIAVARGGPVNVDVAAVLERGIRLVNTPGRNASAVAEFTIGAIIAETRNISRGHAALMRGTWRGELYRADVQRKELSAMTVGIVGYSAVGTRVAALLRGFGSRILVTDPYTALTPEDVRYGARMVALDELLARLRRSDPARATHPRDTGTDRRRRPRPHETRRGADQHRPRTDGGRARAARCPGSGPPVRRRARHVRPRTTARRVTAAAARLGDRHPAHRGSVHDHGAGRGRHGREGSAAAPRVGAGRQCGRLTGECSGRCRSIVRATVDEQEGEMTTNTRATAARKAVRRAPDEMALRVKIIDLCREMNATGLNQGTSGNISARYGERMLITPSGIPYGTMTPEMIARMAVEDDTGAWEGPCRPSSEWHFHRAILRSNDDFGAVVHTHSTFATVLSMSRTTIPACHYIVAAFGGNDVRCADYATYGTAELSDNIIRAMKDRSACLMANHGMVAGRRGSGRGDVGGGRAGNSGQTVLPRPGGGRDERPAGRGSRRRAREVQELRAAGTGLKGCLIQHL